MHYLNVVYYNYFLFYKKVIKDPEPHFATVLSLGFNEAVFINGLIDILVIKWFCFQIPVWIQFGLSLIIIYFNYSKYHRSRLDREIVRTKPTIGKSRSFTTILFFVITISWLFWGPIYEKYLLSLCK